MSSQLRRAGQWLAHSGIQLPDGGVARYYRADVSSNLRVSTEITGYALSAFLFLHESTGDAEYLEHAQSAARFLTAAWDGKTPAMPFELDPAEYAYFFDCGIIVRGLLALWRVSADQKLLDVAMGIGDSMARDFAREDGEFWPILSLPDKRPLEMDAMRWSRSNGCYQLKSALAWLELAEITGGARFGTLYDDAVKGALATHEHFLPGPPGRAGVMDRLHAYLYFLEGLMPRAGEPRCAEAIAAGIERVSEYVEELAPEFLRCDVAAQLLRMRLLFGERDVDDAEAERLRSFQRSDGGFYFGRKGSEWVPHISPVSTSFAMQALEWWERRDQANWRAII